ncbi:MAG: peptidylprolyl isomerase [Betaproteobacteria bacterium RIFCSPLOWO2_02_64_14]|nr:MAG: peptidylprolyl isomerase [Betaproteobacteria bacterium RIFCSPLOWO2_02_64_14]
MALKDSVGFEVSGANARSLEAIEQASHELRCYINDPVATVDRALAESPQLTMGHALRAYLHLLGTEPGGLPVARAACQAGQALPATDRERRHLQAIDHLADGRWRAAGRVLEDLSVEYPRDALALQAGHAIDFFTGDSRMLRDRIARALPAWDAGVTGCHAVLGMHAFGLEETGDYARAEAQGRKSVELEPRDGWGQHAVAHVMEMQGRRRDGIAWMRSNPEAWSRDSFFAVHNWWHVALYHLGLDEVDEVLALYDGPIYGKTSGVVLEMIDASALLWRLHLRGVDVGNRWNAVADNWAPVATARNYAFNDMHAMMAFVGAGRSRATEAVLEAQRAAMDGAEDNASFTREVGYPATQAINAFGDGNYAETVRLLRPVRSYAHRFGGSHAQRDVLDLTLIEAARRAGQNNLVAALLAEHAGKLEVRAD